MKNVSYGSRIDTYKNDKEGAKSIVLKTSGNSQEIFHGRVHVYTAGGK